MNFAPLFTTSRVIVALYRTISTTVLLYYLIRRMQEGRATRDNHHNRFG